MSNERVPHQSTSPVTIPESTCNTIPNVNTVNVETASNVSDNNTPIQNCPESISYAKAVKVVSFNGPGPNLPKGAPINPSTSTSPPIASTSNFTSPENSKNAEILLIVPNDNIDKTAGNMDTVKNIVENKLKDTQVEFIKTNQKSMKIVVGFKTTALRDIGKDKIDSDSQLDSFHYHTKSGSKMLPKIYLSNVLEDVLCDVSGLQGDNSPNALRAAEKTTIVNKILAKNPCVSELSNIGHTLEVVYINKNNSSKQISIGLKVSPAIRLAIMDNQEGNLYLGNSRYQIKDRYHIKYCFHCQIIGHISTDCPNKNAGSVCMYCMGKHRSSTCSTKDDERMHCCARCLASYQANDAENYKSHNASDSKCPVMLREIERLKGNTELMSKNVM